MGPKDICKKLYSKNKVKSNIVSVCFSYEIFVTLEKWIMKFDIPFPRYFASNKKTLISYLMGHSQ